MLKPETKLIYAAIHWIEDAEAWFSWPATRTICDLIVDSGIGILNVIDAVEILEDAAIRAELTP